MRLLVAPLAALSLLAGLGPALARCPLYLPMRVGPMTGNPEKDTVGLFCVQPDAALPPASPASRRPCFRSARPPAMRRRTAWASRRRPSRRKPRGDGDGGPVRAHRSAPSAHLPSTDGSRSRLSGNANNHRVGTGFDDVRKRLIPAGYRRGTGSLVQRSGIMNSGTAKLGSLEDSTPSLQHHLLAISEAISRGRGRRSPSCATSRRRAHPRRAPGRRPGHRAGHRHDPDRLRDGRRARRRNRQAGRDGATRTMPSPSRPRCRPSSRPATSRT